MADAGRDALAAAVALAEPLTLAPALAPPLALALAPPPVLAGPRMHGGRPG